MKTTLLLFAALAASPLLCAQDGKLSPPTGAQELPNQKTKEHEALANLAGHWQTSMKMIAIPGVKGMEKGFESTGTEQAELVCNGLWLKSVTSGTCAEGKPFHGIWLAGYDPFRKCYSSIWACNQEEPSGTADGTWDAATKTWTFTGQTPMGEFRSVYVFQDPDHSTETCYLKGADGKETECMTIARKRVKGAAAADAIVSFAKPASKELALLAEGVGTWDAVVKTSMPGAPATEEKATEHIVPICEGKWFWSDFKGNMMGAPFEGHALTGYEPLQKKFVCYWIDSSSPTFSKTMGTYDEAKKVFTLEGTSVDMAGKPATLHQTCTQSPDARAMNMTVKTAQMTHAMEILYKRAKG